MRSLALKRNLVFGISTLSVDKHQDFGRVLIDGFLYFLLLGLVTPLKGNIFFSFSHFPTTQEAIFQLSRDNCNGKDPTLSGNPHHEIQSDNFFPPQKKMSRTVATSTTLVGSRGVQWKE